MSYISWNHLDKNKKIIQEFKKDACFAPIGTYSAKVNLSKDTKWLEFDLSNRHPSLTDEECENYFLFLKRIPEFKSLLPKGFKKVLSENKFLVDLTKHNGLQVFAILTVVRAIIEEPMIVKTISTIDRNKKYSWSKLDILRVVGSLHVTNTNHWINSYIKSDFIPNQPVKNLDNWNSPVPCVQTGLPRELFITFNLSENMFMSRNERVSEKQLNEVLLLGKERKPKQ